MDFLRKHLEKLVLGLALIALLASIVLLLHSLAKTRAYVAEKATQVQAAATGGKVIEPLNPDTVFPDVNAVLTDPKVRFETLPSEATPPLRGSLYEPVDYIFCYNEACNKLIPYAADKCPFCGFDQPPQTTDRGPKGNDRDNDGIPNHVEQKYQFLNPDNPNDALQDQDQDGFLNGEEFKLNTDMENPASTPPLGALLRIGKLVDKTLPIMLKSISRNNSDDPAAWTVTVQTYDAAKRTWRNRLAAVGKTIDGFTIRSAAFEEPAAPPGKPTPVVVVAPEAGGEPYTLKQGEKVSEHDKFVNLGYFLSRNAQYLNRGGVLFYTSKVGDVLTLTRGREPNLRTEKYQIESIAPDAVQILRTEPAPAQGAEPLRIKVPPFNPKTDFIPQAALGATGMGPEGMMMPGAEGGDPAMMPGYNMVPGGRVP